MGISDWSSDVCSSELTAIDTAAGEVTLDHGAIAELDWPAMTMGFAAPHKLLEGLAVGDRVSFELDWNGTAGTITRLETLKLPVAAGGRTLNRPRTQKESPPPSRTHRLPT